MITYKDSGVDHDKNNELMKKIKTFLPQTGNFSGIYNLNQLDKGNKLLITTDGVGTKTIIAEIANDYSNLGYDLVHHLCNDLLVQGCTKPLFMTDYIASSCMDVQLSSDIIRSIYDACEAIGCKLLGGETAEMPDVYQPNKIDLTGTMVGIIEEEELIDTTNINENDVAIGLASNGFHTNGYSLIRKVFTNDEIRKYAKELLKPHRCYLEHIKLIRKNNIKIKGLCHITGGGLIDNPERILPKNYDLGILNLRIPSEIMLEIQRKTNLSDVELFRTFNCGVGMLVIVDKHDLDKVLSLFDYYDTPERSGIEGNNPEGTKVWYFGNICKKTNDYETINKFLYL